jgi:4-hydroxy-L-threonine phosphate dehydrogenase PdxA
MLEERFVGITMGDPAGIGPEISLKAIDKKNEYKQSVLIYGSYGVLKYYHDLLSLQTPLVRIDRVQEFQKGKINVISCCGFGNRQGYHTGAGIFRCRGCRPINISPGPLLMR